MLVHVDRNDDALCQVTLDNNASRNHGDEQSGLADLSFYDGCRFFIDHGSPDWLLVFRKIKTQIKLNSFPMKQSLNLGRQRFERLLNDPGLLKKVVMIFLLFLLAMTLFRIIVGSLLTVKFFSGARF